MFSLQIEQLARQRQAEREARIAKAQVVRAASTAGGSGGSSLRASTAPKPIARGIRRQTGWAIVSIGLRIAESGNR